MIVSFAGGYLLWTLCEYWVHRTVFHFEPEDGSRRAAALDDPRRPPRPSERPAPAGAAAGPLAAVRRRSSSASSCSRSARPPAGPSAPGSSPATSPTTCCTSRSTTTGRGAGSAGASTSCTCATTSRTTHRGFGVSAPWWDLVFGTVLARARAGESARRSDCAPAQCTWRAARPDPDRERRRGPRPARRSTLAAQLRRERPEADVVTEDALAADGARRSRRSAPTRRRSSSTASSGSGTSASGCSRVRADPRAPPRRLLTRVGAPRPAAADRTR